MLNKAEKDHNWTIELREFYELMGIKGQACQGDQDEELRHFPSSTKTGMKNKWKTFESKKGYGRGNPWKPHQC